jgi:hypothetical protein
MQERGWRKERWLDTVDTTGMPVRVTSGLTVDVHNNLRVGLAITRLRPVIVVGPTAIVTLDEGTSLFGNLHNSLVDLFKEGGGV